MPFAGAAAATEMLKQAGLRPWSRCLQHQLETVQVHGDWPRWQAAIEQMPAPFTDTVILDRAAVQVGTGPLEDPGQGRLLQESLRALHPWRKGPWRLHGVEIDTEWRSDWKWERLAPHVGDLEGRRILDVGCGNGYYAWRMLGAGASLVVGIDPTQLFHAQFQAVARLVAASSHADLLQRIHHLPLGIEQVPENLAAFDTVFSMGVLYHRRSPIDHLVELKQALRPGGELVLETLVIEGGPDKVLIPEGRYAKMRNVWFIPSVAALERWLRRCGYRNIRTISVCATSVEEQRTTEWMRFESLSDFLDPADSTRTIEGYPAPRRAVVLCNRAE
ncbi:MAG: tRNA 5-methoxyuridine(34)/uridine 5-oxyacetic acid(34) synthase CmoB [Gammaproteobacteria bacterium]|nr:MAG: tRNA 5-methoxyuridine(34)/uridine 5-oxyacetic acid(34) synthase CmoB [Gammaproteobacteria bacterium]